MNMNLNDLSLPFPAEDIEWRVSRSGNGPKGIFCLVLAYITARAIQKRLDDVCSPENWKNEEPRILDINGKTAFACGISILCGEQWITKWDVAEPTNVEPAKGGFSGAMKRAGAQWGIGRYLYYLDETFAKTFESQGHGLHYAKLSEKQGGGVYYWEPPSLPAWALPKDPESEVSKEDLAKLVIEWREKFAVGIDSPAERREGFTRFAHSICGEFPVADHTCWTKESLAKVSRRIESTEDANGPDSDVPFGSQGEST